MSVLGSRRAWAAALAAAVLVVVAAPTAAFAYWTATAQAAASARSASFAITGPSDMTATLGGAAVNLEGFTGSRLVESSIGNSGAAPWASVDIALSSTQAFAGPALVRTRVAVASASAACPAVTSGAYVAIPATGVANVASSAAALSPGSTARVCVDVTYSRVSMANRGTSARLSVVVTPRLHNWAVAAKPASLTLNAPTAGVAQCTSGSGALASAKVSFIAPTTGTYRLVVNGKDEASRSFTADAVAAFEVPAKWFDLGDKGLLVQLEVPSGTRANIADARTTRNAFGAVTCAG